MARFFGKNDTTQTRGLMGERNSYYVNAYSKDPNDNLDIKPIVDFNFAERVYYGRVTENLDSIYPNPEFIKPVVYAREPQNAPQLMDFVSDMFTDLSNKFFRSCKLGQIPQDDPFLTDLVAYDSFINPEQDYRNYILGILEVYNDQFLFGQNRASEVKTIDNYVTLLLEYSMKLGPTFPLTFSGFVLSTRSSIFSSGLAVTVADLPMDVDSSKDNLFLLNKTFPLYLNYALNTGFSVNKNVPYMLVADLESPITKAYMAKYLMGTTQSVFTTRYKNTYTSDIEKLITNIVTSYRVFVNKKPFIKKLIPCNGVTKSKIIMKEVVNNNVINKLINNNRLILNVYIRIRNIEEDFPYNDLQINTIIRDSLNYTRKLGREVAMEYVNDKFRSVRKLKNGGTISFLNKQKLKKDLTNATKDDTLI